MSPQFVEDWFGEASCQALAELARSTNHLPGVCVEVGSWEGRSTLALAEAVKPSVVRAVDTWQGSKGEISEQLAAERDVYATFLANTCGHNIQSYRMDWRAYFAEYRARMKFCFIDALHEYEEVRDQITAARELMLPGGVICGDDAHHPPIQQAVLEAFPDARTVATLWVVQL